MDTDGMDQRCFFEWNYIAHQDSTINGVAVRSLRESLGRELAAEYKPKVDYVTYLPRCPELAARSYANHIGAEFLPIFYKMKSERAFQGSTKSERRESILNNLHIIPEVADKIEDKKILVIDDSIIRGTNLERACQLLLCHGRVKKIAFASYTPPIGVVGQPPLP